MDGFADASMHTNEYQMLKEICPDQRFTNALINCYISTPRTYEIFLMVRNINYMYTWELIDLRPLMGFAVNESSETIRRIEKFAAALYGSVNPKGLQL